MGEGKLEISFGRSTLYQEGVFNKTLALMLKAVNFENIVKLNFREKIEESFACEILKRMKNLKTITSKIVYLGQLQVSDNIYRVIAENCERIEKVDINVAISPDTLNDLLRKCKHLKTLGLYSIGISTLRCLAANDKSQRIEGLVLKQFEKGETKEGCRLLSRFFVNCGNNFRSLKLEDTKIPLEEVLSLIAKNCPNFEELVIEGRATQEIKLNSLLELANNCKNFPSVLKITQETALEGCTLEKMEQFGNNFFKRLRKLKLETKEDNLCNLTKLHLYDCPNLEKISLSGVPIKEFSGKILTLKKLRALEIGTFLFTEKEKDSVFEINSSSLTKFKISNSKLNNEILLDCPNLKILSLSNYFACKLVSPANLRKIKVNINSSHQVDRLENFRISSLEIQKPAELKEEDWKR